MFFLPSGLKIEYMEYAFKIELKTTDELCAKLEKEEEEALKKMFITSLIEIQMTHVSKLKEWYDKNGKEWNEFMELCVIHSVVRYLLYKIPIPILDENSLKLIDQLKQQNNELPELTEDLHKNNVSIKCDEEKISELIKMNNYIGCCNMAKETSEEVPSSQKNEQTPENGQDETPITRDDEPLMA